MVLFGLGAAPCLAFVIVVFLAFLASLIFYFGIEILIFLENDFLARKMMIIISSFDELNAVNSFEKQQQPWVTVWFRHLFLLGSHWIFLLLKSFGVPLSERLFH